MKFELHLIFWNLYFLQELIQYLKYTCPAHLYATSISPPAAEQIIAAIKVLLGEDGTSRGLNRALSCYTCFNFYCMDSLKSPKPTLDYNLMSFCFLAGAQKLAQIRENSNFFRSELQKMGFEVLGDNDSPIMPIMLYNPAKIPAFSRECLKQNVSPSIQDMLLLFFFFFG